MAEEAWSFGSGALWPLRLVSICELGHRGPRGLPQEEVQPGWRGDAGPSGLELGSTSGRCVRLWREQVSDTGDGGRPAGWRAWGRIITGHRARGAGLWKVCLCLLVCSFSSHFSGEVEAGEHFREGPGPCRWAVSAQVASALRRGGPGEKGRLRPQDVWGGVTVPCAGVGPGPLAVVCAAQGVPGPQAGVSLEGSGTGTGGRPGDRVRGAREVTERRWRLGRGLGWPESELSLGSGHSGRASQTSW